jgi:hypothetical protein
MTTVLMCAEVTVESNFGLEYSATWGSNMIRTGYVGV